MSDRDEFYRQFSQSYDKLHQSEMQDDLVERVARAACASVNSSDTWEETGADVHEMVWSPIARAAIAVALEEAAKVAEGTRTEAAGNEYQSGKPGDFWDSDSIYGTGRADAAAAIRAMIPKGSA